MNYPPIGTVSEATHRTEDLIPAFMSVLERYAPERYAQLSEECPQTLEDGEYPDYESACAWLEETLFDAMADIAPPYTYFGTHPGDGADFGFWPDIESLEEEARYGYGDAVKVDAGDRWEWDSRTGEVIHWLEEDAQPRKAVASLVMSVTDHGNVTLYDAKTRQEIWSVV